MTRHVGQVRGTEIQALRALSETEYAQYCVAREQLQRVSQGQSTFVIVDLNYVELKSFIEAVEEEYEKNQTASWDIFQGVSAQLNRLMLNFLTTFRVYFDHTETRFKREYGDSEIAAFKTATASEYDSLFAYRFLYKLRNYSQHCGMPIGQFSFSSTTADDGHHLHRAQFFFLRKQLLDEFAEWGEPVTSDLQRMPEQFEVVGLVDQVREALGRINAVVARVDAQRALPAKKIVEGLFEGRVYEPGICVIDSTNLSPMGGPLRFDWPPISALRFLDENFAAQP